MKHNWQTAGITGVYYLILHWLETGLNSGLQGLFFQKGRRKQAGRDEAGCLHKGYGWLCFCCNRHTDPSAYRRKVASSFKHRWWVRMCNAVSFLNIRVWGIPFLYCFQMCNAYWWVPITAGIWNMVLLCCRHKHFTGPSFHIWSLPEFMPRLGFNGAALASVIASGRDAGGNINCFI